MEFWLNSSDFAMVEEKMGGCWSQTKVIEASLQYHFGVLVSVASVYGATQSSDDFIVNEF